MVDEAHEMLDDKEGHAVARKGAPFFRNLIEGAWIETRGELVDSYESRSRSERTRMVDLILLHAI